MTVLDVIHTTLLSTGDTATVLNDSLKTLSTKDRDTAGQRLLKTTTKRFPDGARMSTQSLVLVCN